MASADSVHPDTKEFHLKKWLVLFLASLILGMTFATHIGYIRSTPKESDEFTYTNVTQTMMVVGYPAQDFRIGGPLKFFTFNPLPHFVLLDVWFRFVGGSSIYYGRLLSSFIAVLFVAAIMRYVFAITGSWPAALLTGFTMSFAGWTTTTTLLVKLDTTSTLIGVVGLMFFVEAIRQNNLRIAVYSGLALGTATVWKHVGGYVFLAVLIHWILVRFKQPKVHLVVMSVIIAVLILFIGDMLLVAHDDYLNGVTIQLNRAFGRQPARGLNSGPAEWIAAIRRTYWPYLGSLLSIAVAGLFAVKKALVDHLWRKQDLWLAPLTSSVLAAGLLLAAVRLANPHYFVLSEWQSRAYLIINFIMYLASQSSVKRKRMVLAFIVVVSLLDVGTLVIRTVVFSKADALQATYENLQQIPSEALFFSEEAVCSMRLHPCYTFDTAGVRVGQNGFYPEYIVVQHTATLLEPQDRALQDLIDASTELEQFYEEDAKSKFYVYQTPYAKKPLLSIGG